MIRVRVTTNFNSVPFPSGRDLLTELATNTRPTIAQRLVDRARAKIGNRQAGVRGRLSGLSVPGWAPTPFGTNLYETGRIIHDRIRYSISGEFITFGVSGNARYGRIQKAHEFGRRIPITQAMRRNRFTIAGVWRRIRNDRTNPIIIPQRSYIRGTVYAHELWMVDQIIKAMRRSMRPLGARRGR